MSYYPKPVSQFNADAVSQTTTTKIGTYILAHLVISQVIAQI
jgi:hypothetical protein